MDQLIDSAIAIHFSVVFDGRLDAAEGDGRHRPYRCHYHVSVIRPALAYSSFGDYRGSFDSYPSVLPIHAILL